MVLGIHTRRLKATLNVEASLEDKNGHNISILFDDRSKPLVKYSGFGIVVFINVGR